MIVLVTDGNGGNPLSVRNQIVSDDIKVVTVGIGSGVNENLLKMLAARENFFISVTDTDDLVKKSIKVPDETCKAASKKGTYQEAYEDCDFQFKGSMDVPEYKIDGTPDMAFTDMIVSRTAPRVGVLNTNGIDVEFISEEDKAIPITTFGNPRLTPTHFKPFTLPYLSYESGIGHQTFTGNQLAISKNRCVRIFFSHYQTITMGVNPHVIANVNAQKEDKKCVVFKTV